MTLFLCAVIACQRDVLFGNNAVTFVYTEWCDQVIGRVVRFSFTLEDVLMR